ncbi:hypothetical protein BCF59_0422 [Mycoplasmopsis mustelae]|uniref:Lipoprotein n=1 Tax=Mycoplasmopsis mustelae TaxID=171289 RepID=A0A4R7UD94_9BACT|nr:hypothetical protein [Mycoplasmopsis mustelae]TDV24452.1 hypothetical protein BCF59_0422 [Mycoplasmopsis mustelae]
MKLKKLLLYLSLSSTSLLYISCQQATQNNSKNNDLEISKKENVNDVNKVSKPEEPQKPDEFKTPKQTKKMKTSDKESNITKIEQIHTIKPKTKIDEKAKWIHKKEDNKIAEKYQFPELTKINIKTLLSSQGDLKNPKLLFDKTEFPKNVVLSKTPNNISLMNLYFRNEMNKVLSFIVNKGNQYIDLPKWFTPNFIERNSVFAKIPDLQVYFKDNNEMLVLKHQIMLSHISNDELTIENGQLIFKKEITNFLDKPYHNRKIRFTLQKILNRFFNQFQNQPIVIDVDLDDLIDNKKHRFKDQNYNYDVFLENNTIRLVLSHKDNQKHFSFNDVNQDLFDKFNTITEITYLANQNDDRLFSLSENYLTDDLHAKLSTNERAYDSNNKVYSAQRVLTNQKRELFDNIKKRVFVLGGGTSTMIAKVKPSDPNDQRYYFITNRHVSDILQKNWGNPRISQKLIIPDFDDQKIANINSEISINIKPDNFILNFWQAENQYNRNGQQYTQNQRYKNLNDADISINIIDIKHLLEQAKQKGKTQILNYLNNWAKLPNLKLSKQTKYLQNDNYVKYYVASFPVDAHAGFSGLRYREHIINKIEEVIINDQDYPFTKYGNFNSFILNDSSDNKYDLTSGASGSVVFDENMNMVALFMQNLGNDGYGFGLLNSYDFDYFGYETNSNSNSFKNKLLKEIKRAPKKFEMIEL